MSDITRGHIVYESARAREILKEAVAVELLIAEGAYPQGVGARAVMRDGERICVELLACRLDVSALAGAGALSMTLPDESAVHWSRPMAPGDAPVGWANRQGTASIQQVKLYVGVDEIEVEVDGEAFAVVGLGAFAADPSDAMARLARRLGAHVQIVDGTRPDAQRPASGAS